jgi:hypothetical protein
MLASALPDLLFECEFVSAVTHRRLHSPLKLPLTNYYDYRCQNPVPSKPHSRHVEEKVEKESVCS